MRGDHFFIWSEAVDYNRRRALTIVMRHADGRDSAAAPLVFSDCSETLAPVAMADAGEFMQAMLDHAWSIGMRPAGFADVPLQTQALKDHLQDMRALVFKQDRLILPKAD